MKRLVSLLVIVMVVTVSAHAKTYVETHPSYVPVSGGAWVEVQTSQGRAAVVLSSNYQVGTFGFSGNGDNICNLTASTVNGTIYHQTRFTYYGNPTNLQCRFQRMGTLEVYEPYQSGSSTAYRWTSLPVTQIYATNIGFEDWTNLGRQNNRFLYTLDQRLMIVVVCLIAGLILFKAFRRGWQA